VIAAIWKNDLRHWLIWLNIFVIGALVAYVLYAILAPRRARQETKTPANLTPYLQDEDLEGRRLERVQGWALLFAAVVAVTLPIYWLREPTRQDQSNNYFDKAAVARGAVLFANSASPEYNAAVSLQCANCHGQKGVGGVAPTTINGIKVNWKAPALNTEALRFTEDPACLDQAKREQANPPAICELTDIITYGRPGTPMQPWGVEGGGPKNDQSIADLVAYIESIQLKPSEVQAQEAADLAAAKQTDASKITSCNPYTSCPALEVKNAKDKVAAAKTANDAASAAAKKTLGDPSMSDATLTDRCNAITAAADKQTKVITGADRQQAVDCNTYLLASKAFDKAQAALAWSLDWQKRRANVSDGQILFEINCARCHTQGWSIFDPTVPPDKNDPTSVLGLGLAGGGGGQGGGIGFNLRDGQGERRFGSDESGGWQQQVDFVTNGSNPFAAYGINGIGSGRMPGFGQTPDAKLNPFAGPMLTKEMIEEIVTYERYCLADTNYLGTSAVCDTSPKPRTEPTTTTTSAKG
jgi:mono/diheme cytochrome c family protein